MKNPLPPSAPAADSRWLNQLEHPDPLFWQSLLTCGPTRLDYESPALLFSTPLDLGNGNWSPSRWLTFSQPKLGIDSSRINRIFGVETPKEQPATLEFDFNHQNSRLHLTAKTPACSQTLDHLSAIFGWEMKPETPTLKSRRKLRELPLCPCCQARAEARMEAAPSTPLFALLAERMETQTPVTISINSGGFHLSDTLTPQKLIVRRGWILANQREKTLSIKFAHIHAFRFEIAPLDSPHHHLHLYNSHGILLATLSAPATTINTSWQNLFTNADCDFHLTPPA